MKKHASFVMKILNILKESENYKMFLEKVAEKIYSEDKILDINTTYAGIFVKTSLKTGYCHIIPQEPDINISFSSLPFLGDYIGKTLKEALNSALTIPHPLYRSFAIALIDSSEKMLNTYNGKIHSALLDYLTNKKVVLIGHFKFGKKLREAGIHVDIVELNPREGDIHWDNSHDVLSKADFVFVTGFTLINNTIDEVLNRCPQAEVALAGPSVPLSDKLLQLNIKYAGSNILVDPDKALHFFTKGAHSIESLPDGISKPVYIKL